MDLFFDIKIEDIIAYNLYYYSHSVRIKRRMKIRKYIYIGTGSLLLLISIVAFVIESSVSGIGFLAGACFLFVYYFIASSMVQKNIKKEVIKRYGLGKNDVVGGHNFSITPEEIRDVTEMGEQTVRWDVIEEIVRTEDYIFLIMRASSAAHIVPKRTFTEETEFIKFEEIADNYRREAIQSSI